MGNIYGIETEGLRKIQFQNRKPKFGGLSLENNSKLFEQYFGDDEHGLGFTTEKGTGILSLCTSTEVLESKFIPGIEGVHATRLSVDGPATANAIVMARFAESQGRTFGIFAFGREFETNIEYRYNNCDKVRIADAGTHTNFLALCLDQDKQKLTLYTVSLTGNRIIINEEAGKNFLQFSGVLDFDVTSDINSGIDIFWVTSDLRHRNKIHFKQVFYSASTGWDKGTNVQLYQPFSQESTAPSDSYILKGIAASLNQDSHNYQHNIAVSTFGTKIFAVDLVPNPAKGASSKFMDVNQYDKPPGFDGIEMKVNEEFLVFKGNRVHPPMDSGVFIYRYGRNEDPYVFTSLDLSGETGGSIPPPPSDDEPVPPGHLANLPVEMFKHKGQDKHGEPTTRYVVAVGTNNPNLPIAYFAIENMWVFIPEGTTSEDLNNFKLIFDSQQPI